MEAYVPAMSLDWNTRRPRYDIVIVGSGYGGSITAARLAAANLRPKPTICLLERGREWKLDEFPDTLDGFVSNLRKKENPLGLYDIVNSNDITVLKGNGLGGTSLVNANVAIIPDDSAFQAADWPAGLNRETLAPYYRLACDILKPTQLPPQDPLHPPPLEPRKRLALEKRARELGMHTELADIVVTFEDTENPFGVRQPKCIRCGDCVTGCRVGSKNTLQMNYLPWAWRNLVEIFTQNEVQWIERDAGGDWTLHGLHYADTGEAVPFDLTAGRVILSAGSINSTEILLRSRDHGLAVSDKVGTRFSGNGDFFGIAYNGDDFLQVLGFGNHPDSPGARHPPGPTITTKLQYTGGGDRLKRFLVEDLSFPTAFREAAQKGIPSLYADGDFGNPDQQQPRFVLDDSQEAPYSLDGALNHSMLYLLMAYDNAGGRIQLQRSSHDPVGKPVISWPEARNLPIFRIMTDELREHARALAAWFVQNPAWETLGLKHLITAHPLGGCPMGDDSGHGAVNQYGQVFAADGSLLAGLRVVDGSLIPAALGANPLFTISALAERIAEDQIAELARA